MRAVGLLSLVACALLAVAVPVPASGESLQHTATADATVRSNRPSKNFGSRPQLDVDGSPATSSLVRFDVVGVGTGTVTSARLVLRVVDTSPEGGTVRAMDPSAAWSETSVTWDDAATAVGPTLETLGRVEAGETVEVDVTSAVTGDGPVAFRIDGGHRNRAAYGSREAGASVAPRLVVEIGGSALPDDVPTADASLRSNRPAKSFGSRSELEVDASPETSSLLRFEVGGVGSGTVTSARLVLHVVDSSPKGGEVRRVDPSATWSETSVTWATAPPAGAVLTNLGRVTQGETVEKDVTAAVTGDGPVTFRIDGVHDDRAAYASREAGAALAPRLVVVVGEPGPGPEPGPALSASTLQTGLQVPWDIVFTPDGRIFLTERDAARVLEFLADGTRRTVTTFDVDAEGEGGVLGLTASPAYDVDGWLYTLITTTDDQRVVRFRADTDDRETIVTGLPDHTFHNAGRIRFGPDGMLYIGMGDVGDPDLAQDLASLGGKILRYTPTGGVPADNPFGTPVWAYGLRDPQGLAWDAAGRMFATEFGPDRDDEINRILPGENYGWPRVTGVADEPGLRDPVVVRQPSQASWSGASVLVGGDIPDWEGDLFVAALRGQRLYRIDLEDGAVQGVQELLVGQYGRLRHVAQAPDGSLWILTSNRDGRGTPVADDDRIVRLGR